MGVVGEEQDVAGEGGGWARARTWLSPPRHRRASEAVPGLRRLRGAAQHTK